MKISKIFLLAAGILSFSVALFQAVITFSPAWSRYLGAPEESNLVPPTGLSSSVISLLIGLIYLIGTFGNWQNLRLVNKR